MQSELLSPPHCDNSYPKCLSVVTASHPVAVTLCIQVPPMLTDAERQQVLVEWNETARDYPLDRPMHVLFEEQVARTPHAIALIFGDEQITYRDLNRRANRIARQLRALGVGPEILVGLCMERAPEQVASLFGILKAGGAYVPLDPNYPRERLALIVEDTQIPVLLTQSALVARLPEHRARVLCIEDDLVDIGEVDDVNVLNGTTADSLAYVIYTSGSTGLPKGVLIDQRGLVNHTFAMIESHALDSHDRMLQFSSLSFDAAAASLFPPLLVGAALVLPADASSVLLGSQLTRLCEEQQITAVQLPASVWHQWVDALLVAGATVPASLRVLLVGGESPSLDKLRAWAGLIQRPMTFLNAYGPTEAAIASTLYQMTCDAATVATLTSVPIGQPLANKQIYLLDAYLQPVPVGVVGELYVSGVGLARGYLHRPEVTAEKFVCNPFAHAAETRMYRTGDRAHYRADGTIEFVGRVDHQIKLRGFRIELGEIETVLEQHSEVRHAIALIREGSWESVDAKQLVAYVVPTMNDNRESLSFIAELRAFLQAKLPEYMVPSAFVLLDSLPLTPHGKVDRRALPAPEVARPAPDLTVAPRTPEEVLLTELWAKVLGLSTVGVHDDFFALGGHSMLAAQLITLVNAALNRDIPLRLLFAAPTVATFAQAIKDTVTMTPSLTAPDLAAEVVLDPAIIPAGAGRWSFDPAPTAIFVTGVTGFLGAFLLHELLLRTAATIYCLVRAADMPAAWQRIQQTLTSYQIWQEEWRSRIVPVCSDLRKAHLGIDPVMFEYLTRNIDVIYHAGAQVNYLYSYTSLKATNVQGTVEVLRLACQARPKPVHYISTIAVPVLAGADGHMSEEDNVTLAALPMGYAQSKWVAEGMLQLARQRGLPVTIYRPSRISSHSQSGVANQKDFFVRMLTACLQLGLAPDIPMVENLIPVDYVARAIVHLSRQSAAVNATFHLLNPAPSAWTGIIGEIQALGYALELVPYQEWYAALRDAAIAAPATMLLNLLPLLPVELTAADWRDFLAEPEMSPHQPGVGVVNSDIRCLPIDATVLAPMLAAGVQQGLFAEPARTRTITG